MDFHGVMVDPKEEDDPLSIKCPLMKAENEVSCVRVCAPAYSCALLITVFNPLCSGITSVVTVRSVQHVLFDASLQTKEVVLWTVIYKKVKQSHYRPWGFQKVEAPRFQNNRHMKVVRLSALCTGCLYSQEVFLVLISVRGWVNPRAIVRREGLCQWKIPLTSSGIEPATFRIVVWCPNWLCYDVPPGCNIYHLICLNYELQQLTKCLLWNFFVTTTLCLTAFNRSFSFFNAFWVYFFVLITGIS